MTISRTPSGDPGKLRASSWRRKPLERVLDEEIDRLGPASLDELIALFEQFLAENNPPTKKMGVAARLKYATARRGS